MSVLDARVRLPQDRRPDPGPAELAVLEQYGEVFDFEGVREAAGTAALLAALDDAGVDAAVVHAEHEAGDQTDALNEAVAGLVSEHPDRFVAGVGTVSLERLTVRRAVRQTEDVARLGLVGVSIQPAFFGLAIDERRLWPVYAKAEELGLTVALHTGVNYARDCPIEGERPVLVDRVASDFPDLRLVALHGGWPWTTELAAVCRRHPNVWFDIGGAAPKYLAEPATGWDVLMRLSRNVLRDQVLWATDWPVVAPTRSLSEWRAAGLGDAVVEASCDANVRAAYGLA